MELPNINNKNMKTTSVFGPLKFNASSKNTTLFTNSDRKALTSLQTDNLFFRQKLAEFEVRLDNISQGDSQNKYDPSKHSKFNRFNSGRLREAKPDPKLDDDFNNKSSTNNVNNNGVSRKQSCLSQISDRLNTGRSSILTARTNESVSKIDEILNNLKK